jgi:hypothetical protein
MHMLPCVIYFLGMLYYGTLRARLNYHDDEKAWAIVTVIGTLVLFLLGLYSIFKA